MISLKRKNYILSLKVIGTILAISSIFFLIRLLYIDFKNKSQINRIKVQIEEKKKQNSDILDEIEKTKKLILDTKNAYPTTKEIEEKVKKVFSRLSLLDYQLFYLGSKQLCLDRHIIVAKLDYLNQKGLKVGEGILNFLGNTQQSVEDPTVYYVDYISTRKDLENE